MAGWGTEEPKQTEEERESEDTSLEEQSLPPAPSLGPHTTIDREPTSEALARNEVSEVDAMGLDKRRSVMGQTYGPTKTRVVGTFAAFFAIVAVVAVGFYFLAKELDKAPETNADAAPWSAPDAPQRPPKQLQ